MRALTNDGWGFASNCFVCEPRNDAGLRIPFHHDEDAGIVVAHFRLDDRFSGAPSYVHGGVALAVLDEAMAWAAIALAGRFAVTVETTTRFERPVRVDREHTVRAWRAGGEDQTLALEAEIVRDDGKRCAAARATFAVLDAARAADATGAAVTGLAAEHVAEG